MVEHAHEHPQPHDAGHDAPVAVDTRPKLAVWKFASCDGCQLSILNCEDELLQIAENIHIAYFPEATRAIVEGPYELSLVEGSITTPEDVRRIHEIRAQSGTLVTIGACATAGGIQALRNWADVDEFRSIVYAHPEYLSTLDRSTPIASHVDVDYELRGCPVDKTQLVEVLAAFLNGRKPRIPTYSVCVECKLKGNVCVPVATGTPCLGPVTQAGCGALCPSYGRGCYGCFGPQDSANTDAMTRQLTELGMTGADIVRVYRTFNAGAPEFAAASDALEAAAAASAGGGEPS
ncbi:oxidoreductase [Demequina mangrovi]|uniref:Coenzyme F420-reducing hydrogenase, gamma subunit n=1 Tax=Demequina mangrovi TaxID=1043493 RepID=A0A1H6ZCW7_9MICO|nr:oxidoreductase [Demequina mangrovi]SEJ51269.1 Coenzyme F420-reducing hydrogenase, gamma subunit [Demequina mangrovi]